MTLSRGAVRPPKLNAMTLYNSGPTSNYSLTNHVAAHFKHETVGSATVYHLTQPTSAR